MAGRFFRVFEKSIVPIVFGLGLWLLVIKPLGPAFRFLPGDLGDARLNNFLLEHFYRWISGLEKSFWTAPMFYPFPDTLGFGDNLLGSGLFYAIFRRSGFDRETAFQGWYITGFCLNYFAAVYCLRHLRLSPLAVAGGAFFFTFALPVMAQDGHSQLLYRFGVPLACFYLLQILDAPKLRSAAALLFWVVWQFYLSIYTGVFLSFLLIGMGILLPFSASFHSVQEFLMFWPGRAKLAWTSASQLERLLVLLAIIFLLAFLWMLLWPYYQVSKTYNFSRTWFEIERMLPVWQSYLLADRSHLWKSLSGLISKVPMRNEQQLFPGIMALILALVALFWAGNSKNYRIVLLHFASLLLLVALTVTTNGASLYQALWRLPGINSIRAVSRIILIMVWPLAILVAYGVEALMCCKARYKLFSSLLAFVFVGLLIAEPAGFDFTFYDKAASQLRIAELRKQIPTGVSSQPILFVANTPPDQVWATEIDGMLLAQTMGWPTYNGYSGNSPYGFGRADCASLPNRIMAYMDFKMIDSHSFYLEMLDRTVTLGFDDCDRTEWATMPFSGLSAQGMGADPVIKIISMRTTNGRRTFSTVEITNNTSSVLSSHSSSPFQISWRLINAETGKPISFFTTRRNLDADIPIGGKAKIKLEIETPLKPGQYRLEFAGVQNGIVLLFDPGLPIVRSLQRVVVNDQGQVFTKKE
jgi:hypothetical protein